MNFNDVWKNDNAIGSKPLKPAVYDVNITPLESINKLQYKINELIGDDSNVKEVVDRLLNEYESHFQLHGGYCEELRCIAFENPLSANVISSTTSPIYTPTLNLRLSLGSVTGNPTFYQWQYKNDNGVFVDLEANGSNSEVLNIPVSFYGDKSTKEFRCKLQNNMYTYYTVSDIWKCWS